MGKAIGIALVVALWTAPAAIATKKNPDVTLFKRLGGKKVINAVVDDFVERCAADARLREFFVATLADKKRLKAFKGKLRDQFCELAGGPCKYLGRDMKSAHRDMGISPEHFDAMMDDLVATLKKFKVPPRQRRAVLALVQPMKSKIVEAAPARDTASSHKD